MGLRLRRGRSVDTLRLETHPGAIHHLIVSDVGPGTDYQYVLEDGSERSDPVSRFRPAGVHGPTRIVDPAAYRWSDHEWRGLEPSQLVIYELHIGTFTPEGTFDSAITRLRYLRELGVTAIEVMPVAEFPGSRNWGYDGVSLYSPQSTYGGPDGFKRLVDAAHAEGLGVILDVVYNHLGPEGLVPIREVRAEVTQVVALW
ncbi:MAG TPA: alpha-amylase family glycosyl hydrolase, partial [Gemmatimonadales bacterium]|nr:alpha-amylase family glycosyl hydrolase [Gemmatimonadales bacterium]